ncbi:MAG: salicylaldehyde dehydrogenase [Rhodobacteraceae bacterium]|nr:MAG: salicylaldehyde dehydrogenase [Paracoccaceae bacterium]
MTSLGLKIDGNEQAASNGATFERLNPITGKVATTAAAATVKDAKAAADAAARALPAWGAVSPRERRSILLAAADSIDAKVGDFITAMADETGSTEGWTRFNVGLASDILREAAAMTTQITGEIIPSNRPGSMAMAVRQPAGVVLSIAPWNAPVILGTRGLALPLACGNTVVFKTSEACPKTHCLIVDALEEAGLPAGVVNVISNAPADAGDVVEAIIAHPAVRRINFTGSTNVGRIIAQTAGKYLKPCLLELGGKAPLVVLDDADIPKAVAAAAFGAYMNQGQICMSTERLVVDNSIADEFVAAMTAKVKTLVAGNPVQANTPLGSLIDNAAGDRVEAMIADAVSKGATLVAGGRRDGTLMDAALLDNVTSEMDVYHHESFGPLTSIVRVDGEAEALRVANDTDYGLVASVFTKDTMRGMAFARKMESGICHVNGPTVHDEAQMPFGGVKQSGYGRFGGTAGINEFTELRWMTVQDGDIHYPI